MNAFLSASENDPAFLSSLQLKDYFGPRPLVVCQDVREVEATIRQLRQGESVWEYLLIAVLIALLAETLVANQITAGTTTPFESPAPRRPYSFPSSDANRHR